METAGVGASDCQRFPEAEGGIRGEAGERESGGGDESVRRGSGKVCEECGENSAKYSCPACGLRSCGVGCVKAHKERTGCTGKRDRTAFVPISQCDDNLMISDYNLLEEILKSADAAKRTRAQVVSSEKLLSPQLIQLKRQAKNRNINLFFLAHGMTRRESNTTFYSRRAKCMFWKVEWRFNSTDVCIVDGRVNENMILGNILEKHLAAYPGNAAVRHKLRSFLKEPIHHLKLLMRKEPYVVANEEYFELSMSDSLRSQLAYKRVYEFPVIYVVLPTEVHKFKILPELVSPFPVIQAPKAIVPLHQEYTGTRFQEEEIEEGEIVE